MPENFSRLQLPIGEGSRIPLDNEQWQSYLTSEFASIDTNFDLKLPLWGLEKAKKTYSWVLLSPFSNHVSFTKIGSQLNMQSQHEFNRFNQHKQFKLLLHVGNSLLSGAVRYREYLQKHGELHSLHDKFATVPEGKKLIGATHIYLWGNSLLAQEDVKNWPALIAFLQSPAGKSVWQHITPAEQGNIEALHGKQPANWQKQAIIDVINDALVALRPLNSSPEEPGFLSAQQQQAAKIARLAQQLLGKFLAPRAQWGPGLSGSVITSLHQAGLTRLWLGTDNWTANFLHPEAVKVAQEAGYLVGTYDSYDTGILRGANDSWLTAQLPAKVTQSCAIIRADGSKKPGFGGQGYYLNPGCVLPFSKGRMSELVKLAKLNSLFLDVDGTGMVSDDYNSEHPTGAAEMAAARNARMAWFGNSIKLPLGSEDGNAVTATNLMFAHGLES